MFDGYTITNKGLQYLAATATGKKIVFTKAEFGRGLAVEDATAATALTQKLGTLPIASISSKGNICTINVQFTNKLGSSLITNFNLTEMGIYAKVQNASGEDDLAYPEVLVIYAGATIAEADYIPNLLTEFLISFIIVVVNAANVAALIDKSLVYVTKKDFDLHAINKNNPHEVTKVQIGLGNVDNTSDASKPVSTAQAAAINAKYSKPSTGIPKTDLASAIQTSLGKADTALQSFTETDPTVPSWAKAPSKPTYTKAEVGLDKVDNTSDASKPVSTAQAAAINAKYSKPSTGIPKTDLASAIQTSLGKADTALQSFTETDPTVPSWAKAPSKPTYTKAEVGLDKVDNTADSVKNVATAVKATNDSSGRNIVNTYATKSETNAKATTVTYSASITTSWSGSTAPFTQNISVSGIKSSDNPIVDAIFTTLNFSTLEPEWGKIFKITTNNNLITVYAKEKTTASIPIQLKVVR